MKALAFIDLLGFSQMVNKDVSIATTILNDFYNISFSVIKDNGNVEGHLFSDSLLAFSDTPADLVNSVTEIYRRCLRKNSTYGHDLAQFFLLPRGGISLGIVDIQHRIEAPNLRKDFIVSPALVHSAKLESLIKGSRLLIADPVDNQVFNRNSDINSILYENSTFTFWSNHKYFDSLWFLDLGKEHEDQMKEVVELVDISINLAKNSSNNKSVLEQYLQTLRIGLLSFTKFLTPNSNPILERVISDFSEDKYWIIWMTVFEMVMQSPDNWAFPGKLEIINFYKDISLKESWANLIKEINKPNNVYIKGLFSQFLDELSIDHIIDHKS